MEKLTFMTLAVPGQSVQNVILMTNSLREFGGQLAETPVWLLVPADRNQFSAETRHQLDNLHIEIMPVEIDPEMIKFPFAAKIAASAYAESVAAQKVDMLAWLDNDNIIVNAPVEFLLPEGKALGYRPVHHRLIGPAWSEPLDPFWELVYETCQVPEGRDFLMETHTGEKTKPYFNAGTFVVRSERRLLQQWLDTFLKVYQQPEFTTFYDQNQLYAIFIHQAVWTGGLLRALKPDEMQLLSPKINYPLHLHHDVPVALQPKSVKALTTLRYENIFENPGWREKLPILEPLANWIETQLEEQNSTQGAA